jgi:predicted RND superfamily exporter protein/outer membrane lipoprotein-sorting protein
MKQFYPAQHPLLLQEEKISKLFKIDKNLSVVILLQTKDQKSWLETKNYSFLKNLTSAFKKDEKLKSVISIATLQGAQDSGEQLDVGPLFEKGTLLERQKAAHLHPFVKPHLLSKNEDAALVILNLNETTLPEVYQYTEGLKKYFNAVGSDYQISVGGLSVLQADLSMLLKKELFRSILIGLLLFVLGLLLIYKNPLAVFSVMITLLFVNVVILGLLASFNIPLNVLLSTLPILISLGVISLIIHIQGHFNKTKNIFLTYRDLFWENLLAVLISGIGFLILKTSSSQLIQNYGVIVAMASFASWFLTHLVYWPLSFVFKNTDFRDWLLRPAYWSLWSLRHRQSVILSAAVVFVLGAVGMTKVNWNSRVLDDLPEHQNTRRTTEYMDRQFGGTLEMNFVIKNKKKSQDWNQALSIKKLDEVIQKIRRLAVVGSVISVNDFYKSIANIRLQSRLPASNADLSEKNFLFSLAAQNPIDSMVSDDKKSLLVKIRYKDVPSDRIQSTSHHIERLLNISFPSAEVTKSGFAEQFHVMNQEISKDLVFSFWHALLVACVILIFVFKSWRLALLACLPNMLPPFALLAWVSYQQVSLKPTVAIIFSIAIGLAFTNTVYIIGRILKLKKEFGSVQYLPLKRALLEESNSCLVATLLVVLGFVVFLFSYFGVNRLFGQYMILSVLAALAGDLIFMPSFLQQFKKYFISATLFVLLTAPHSEAAVPAKVSEILTQVQKTLSSKDDSAQVKMKIIEADGSSKERELTIKRKFSNNKNQTFVKILKPTDQRGAGFLSVVENGSEQQWIFLPSSKQVRRFVSKNKQEGVLGSELSPQDLDLTTVKSAEAKLLKIEKVGKTDVATIEVVSKSNATAYSKAQLWINLSNHTPIRIEYYDAQGQALKRVEFLNYTTVNKIQRAQKVVIKNLKNKRGTELLLSEINANSGLSDDAFTQRALSKD